MSTSPSDMNPGHFLASDFAPLLSPFDLDLQDRHRSTLYGLRRDLTIGYVNAEWIRYALEHSAPRHLIEPDAILGRCILDAISGPLHRYYHNLFQDTLRTARPRVHEYECSTPNALRYLHMDLLPIPFQDPAPKGLLTIHSQVRSRSIPDDYGPPSGSPHLEEYLTPHGLLVSCSNCRRFRSQQDPQRWDWIPEYLNAPPATISHGLCEICLDYYHPIEK